MRTVLIKKTCLHEKPIHNNKVPSKTEFLTKKKKLINTTLMTPSYVRQLNQLLILFSGWL